jgi:tRNA(His) 5'-end guanylyltransferase
VSAVDLGDRMKMYEGVEAQRRLMPLLPVIARLDGRNFHTFTRDLPRPYDLHLMQLMRELTALLVRECNARLGYTQSDEITLVMYTDDPESQTYFDGRIQKMTSALAAFASVHFNALLRDSALAVKAGECPTFDCRVWNVPSLEEAANCVMWREWDATKNSISMAAQSKFSHARLQGKNGKEMQEMLFQEHGINWSEYPAAFKRGTYVRRVTTSEPFTAEEIAALPEKHRARTNPDLLVERSRVEVIELPPLASIINRSGALFRGCAPVVSGPESVTVSMPPSRSA